MAQLGIISKIGIQPNKRKAHRYWIRQAAKVIQGTKEEQKNDYGSLFAYVVTDILTDVTYFYLSLRLVHW